ncbi:hypothetical protein TSOC_000359 [Tetrabaena socialis]|uniref:Uncharacterized protein n=1 Tax=Tetrabaena socialis TaxID=47790 RepID=A0A2J8AJI3_9CHLO|nr:hypothetical protein TSOC_000359 [Tetrabaena socialis]|eukprot:PNH12663.1 hypothetical protein TSOC_000359 [Tetrabaena socialis]
MQGLMTGWGVWYGFFLVIVILIMAVLGKTDAWTSTLQALCAALMSVSMNDADEWLSITRNPKYLSTASVNAALAGFIIMSAGVALVIIFLGMGGINVDFTVSVGGYKTTPVVMVQAREMVPSTVMTTAVAAQELLDSAIAAAEEMPGVVQDEEWAPIS